MSKLHGNFFIKKEGAGGFINPPGHAEHDYSVQEVKGQNSGFMSLSYALQCDYIPDAIKAEAKRLLKKNPGELTEEWIHSCYNYFRNCYAPENLDRNVSNCIIDKENELPAIRHLAYLHIKSFFPEHEPRLDLIENNGPLGAWSKS